MYAGAMATAGPLLKHVKSFHTCVISGLFEILLIDLNMYWTSIFGTILGTMSLNGHAA